jgi:beta-glucanase (GH16 family)
MENFGTAPAWVYGTVHGPGYSGESGIGGEFAAGVRLADDFHAYAVHWEPARIRWFFDGTLYHTVTPASLGAIRGFSTTSTTCC